MTAPSPQHLAWLAMQERFRIDNQRRLYRRKGRRAWLEALRRAR